MYDAEAPNFLQGGGEMGRRIREFDWKRHPLGPPHAWPPALRMATSLCLNSTFPTAVYWGPDLHVLYNDAWAEVPADRHPWALGQKARDLWSDIWPEVAPGFEQAMSEGKGQALYEVMLPMVRHGEQRETWWNYSLTPIRQEDQSVGGVFNQGNEVTAVVMARRARQAEVQRWRELFLQAPAAIALLHGPEHVYEVANEAYLRLVGHRELLGKTVKEALPEVESQGFIELLDKVFQSGEPHLGTGIKVKLQRLPGAELEDSVLDFIYQPYRDATGKVEGIFVLVTDVTERANAEAALRTTNWQLREERAKLAIMVEAEQRAQTALKRFNDTLEAHVRQRIEQLSQALEHQGAVTDRLRATFETSLIFQGYMDPAGLLLDANRASLAAISATLGDVVGRLFWDTPWFSTTEGMPELVREGVSLAARGRPFTARISLNLKDGPHLFDFSLRPVFNSRDEVIGIVPEAVDLTARTAASSGT